MREDIRTRYNNNFFHQPFPCFFSFPLFPILPHVNSHLDVVVVSLVKFRVQIIVSIHRFRVFEPKKFIRNIAYSTCCTAGQHRTWRVRFTSIRSNIKRKITSMMGGERLERIGRENNSVIGRS